MTDFCLNSGKKMLSSTTDLSKERVLKIKQDDKFYSRLLTKETSVANPSFRVYYAGAGAVPFGWESQPGTPKNSVPAASIPPLTPPPSYQYSTPNHTKIYNKKYSLKSSLIHTILPRLTLRKSAHSPPPPTLALPSLPPSVSSSSSSSCTHRRRRFSGSRSSFSSRGEDDDDTDDGSPTSTLCFGARHKSADGKRNTLLSVAGQGLG